MDTAIGSEPGDSGNATRCAIFDFQHTTPVETTTDRPPSLVNPSKPDILEVPNTNNSSAKASIISKSGDIKSAGRTQRYGHHPNLLPSPPYQVTLLKPHRPPPDVTQDATGS